MSETFHGFKPGTTYYFRINGEGRMRVFTTRDDPTTEIGEIDMTDMGHEFRDDAEHDPYADGTYGTNYTPASSSLERDKREEFSRQQSVVMELARNARYHGITGADVIEATGWNDSPKSRAMSNLLRDGALVRLRERRDRGHVHVTPEWVAERPTLPYISTEDKHRAQALHEAAQTIEGLVDDMGDPDPSWRAGIMRAARAVREMR